MPKSVYHLFKYVNEYSPPCQETIHYCCDACHMYLGTAEVELCPAQCENFGTIPIYVLSIADQLKYLFEQRGLGRLILKANESRRNESHVIRDICDGSEYQRVNCDRNDFDLTLMLSTDGAVLKHSSKADLWPVTFMICEIPITLRRVFITCAAIWYAKCKPSMNTFLLPVCVQLKQLNKEGLKWIDPETHTPVVSKVYAPLVIGDAPAISDVLNMLYYNGKYGCKTCEIKTSRTAMIEGERRRRVYKYREELWILRTKPRMIVFGKEAESKGTTIKGLKGRTIVSLLPRIDESTFVLPEFMHSICLGVIKQTVKLWMDRPLKEYLVRIDEDLVSIKPPYPFRPPQPVKDHTLWKAYEYLYWGLFYSVLILQSLKDDALEPYFQHWLLFVIPLNTLMQEKMDNLDLDNAEKLFHQFVKEFETLYGEKELTYNLHQLIHIVLHVRRWGPIWCTSAFPFEDYIGNLGKAVHGHNLVGKEIVTNIQLSQGVQFLKNSLCANVCGASPDEDELVCCGKAVDKKTLSVAVLDIIRSANFCPESAQVFKRAKVRRDVFTSMLYKDVLRICYCVRCELKNNSVVIGAIKFFFKCEETSYVVIEPFAVDQENLLYHKTTRARVTHILPIKRGLSSPRIINFNDVKSWTKLLFHDNFIGLIPKPLRSKSVVF